MENFISTKHVVTTTHTGILVDIDAITRSIKPLVISTWNHGIDANKATMKVLLAKGQALDAVEAGLKISEADPNIQSVGFGGRPDGNGNITKLI